MKELHEGGKQGKETLVLIKELQHFSLASLRGEKSDRTSPGILAVSWGCSTDFSGHS